MSDQKASARKTITSDPLYYIVAAFFALLTTALPAILGQPRFLPIIQTLSLITFISVALHNRNVRGAITIIATWLPIQFLVILLLTRLLDGHLETAFSDGFAYRAAITAWFFAGAPHPAGLANQPLAYLIEFGGVVIGSLVTAGLVGTWFLMRLVNQAAYGTGILLATLANPGQAFLVIPYWTLMRAAGYAGLIVLCAMPLLTYRRSPTYYWQYHRKLILVSLALVAIGILVELFLPGIVARPPLN